jgi:hypothetical protein
MDEEVFIGNARGIQNAGFNDDGPHGHNRWNQSECCEVGGGNGLTVDLRIEFVTYFWRRRRRDRAISRGVDEGFAGLGCEPMKCGRCKRSERVRSPNSR